MLSFILLSSSGVAVAAFDVLSVVDGAETVLSVLSELSLFVPSEEASDDVTGNTPITPILFPRSLHRRPLQEQ